MRTLFPELEPYACHRFQRGRHQLYVEECGNPAGLTVLFLHGGPGSGCRPYQRRYFDPQRHRIILIDQRGSGRSTPGGELRQNETRHLLADLEWVRRQLGITRWLLFGGSWGATLALVYAQRHPRTVLGMVLRGTFLGRQRDLDWFVGPDGARRLFPDRWAACTEGFSAAEQAEPIAAFHRRLFSDDELGQRRAARQWAFWSEQLLYGDGFDPARFPEHVSLQQVHRTRIELHYAARLYDLAPTPILDHCEPIARVPTIICHGRLDLVCPLESAYLLHRCLPQSELWVLPNTGHLATEPAMVDALVRAVEVMADRVAG